MPDTSDHADPILLDNSSVEIWGLQGSGYSAKLVGEIDDRWAESFIQAQHAHDPTTRFYLDRRRGVLVFSAGTGEDPQRILAEARFLLDLTNRRTGRQLPQKAVETVAAEPSANEETHRLTPRSAVRVARMDDTRGSKRVSASLMVQFRGRDSFGPGSTSTGMTRDLSEGALFIVTNRLPAVGEALSLRIHLAAQQRIDLTGEVVRVLDKDEARKLQLRPGFAARVRDRSGKDSFGLLVRSQP
jgi:hypothetical protein